MQILQDRAPGHYEDEEIRPSCDNKRGGFLQENRWKADGVSEAIAFPTAWGKTRNSSARRARETAKSLGEKLYWTGSPCIHGHMSPRYTSSGQCYECTQKKSYTEKPKSPRALAIESGAKTYFSGKPCKNGHIAERYVSSETCKTCAQEAKAKRRGHIPWSKIEELSNDRD